MGRPGFEESSGPGGPGRKEYARADSDNWRTLREEQDEDEGESGSSWRMSGPRRDGTGQASISAASESKSYIILESGSTMLILWIAFFLMSRAPFTLNIFISSLILYHNLNPFFHQKQCQHELKCVSSCYQ